MPDQAEGQKSFLHTPTTSDDLTTASAIYDINIGEDPEIKYYFEEMRRRHMSIVMLQGEDMFFLQRKMSGTRCPFWKSEEEQCERPVDSRAACYNTGWIGGYHAPMLIKVVVPPANRTAISYENGVRVEYKPRPWTIHTPTLHQRDLLIARHSGNRYEVLDITGVTFRGLVMHQEFTLREATRDKESFIFDVSIPNIP